MPQLSFDASAFSQAIRLYTHFQASNGWESGGPDNDSAYNQLQAFTYHDPASGKQLDYAVWYPEHSAGLGGGLLTLSAKVDYRRTTGDDHLLVLCSVDSSSGILSAQTTAQFQGAGSKNFSLAQIKAANVAGGNVPRAVYDAMYQRQLDVDYGGHTDNAGRHGLAYIAQAVLECMHSSLVIG